MDNNVRIRRASIEDVFVVNNGVPEFCESLEKYSARLEGNDPLMAVALVSDDDAGFLVSYDRYGDGSLYCWMVGVKPKFRRKGVLSALMGYQDWWASSRSYSKIRIKTRNSRRAMLAYLVREGYLITGVDVRPDPEDNRIHLEKSVL